MPNTFSSLLGDGTKYVTHQTVVVVGGDMPFTNKRVMCKSYLQRSMLYFTANTPCPPYDGENHECW